MKITENKTIVDFIQSYNFGVLLSPSLDATHLPLIIQPDEGDKGVLYGHFARANSHWKQFDKQFGAQLAAERVLVIFQGKEKLGQHRKAEDQRGVYRALQHSAESSANALARYMAKRSIGTGTV